MATFSFNTTNDMQQPYKNHRQFEQVQIGDYHAPGDLDISGFEADMPGRTRDDNFRLDRVEAALIIVKAALQRDTSYEPKPGISCDWIKCRTEERLGYFITQGEFILAMIAAGFKYRRRGQTCVFLIRSESIANLRGVSRPN